ncbi:EpsG family protein [Bacillus sp. sid0103]|uniref:EpsG family protein n=1 Tax=Bacillus sp. sid0103 TaxID=2856337 RepID=UPI001C474D31|nr:EpsG family protein [Bacillus sp. sid0103]MBV7508971.1 EpsG family protein [Bacillus sp. sid0103]
MTVFYCLILWLGTISLFSIDIKDKQNRNRIVIVLACFGIFLIQAFRAETIGHDLISYLPGYHMAESINIFAGERLFNYEIGYIFYSQVFSKLNFSNQWYLAVVALTIIAPIAYVWSKNSKMPGLSVFIYITLGFFTFSFSGLRQSIAMAIVFFSFKYIQKKSLIKFLLCVALAMLFHTTAIIFIFAYPLYYVRFKSIHFLFIIPSLIIIFILKTKIFLLIYRLYRGAAGDIEATNAYTMLIVMILVLIFAYIFGSKDKQNIRFNSYKNYMLVAILIQIFASQSSEVMRAGYYYYLFITLLIPEVIKNQRDLKVRILVVGVLILALMYFFQTTTGNGYLDVSPYHFYWE